MMTEAENTSPTSTTPSSDVGVSRKMDDKIAYRKNNKPMMEKKRRARINSCLGQLKSLVLQAMKKDNSQYSKLEKADILEMTVKHLKNVQRLQNSAASGHVPDAMGKYRAGFNECANEVVRYLGETQTVGKDARTRILSHLSQILTPINSLPLQHAHTPILPAPAPVTLKQEHSQQEALHNAIKRHQQQQHHQQQLVLQQQVNSFQQQQQQQQQPFPPFLASHVEPLNLVDEKANRIRQSNDIPTSHSNHGGKASAGEVQNILSSSPTAFQPPVVSTMMTSSSLQFPVASNAITAAAAAAGAAPLQLVPNNLQLQLQASQLQLVQSTLPNGQVALVLTPKSMPPMNLYAPAQNPNRQSVAVAAAAAAAAAAAGVMPLVVPTPHCQLPAVEEPSGLPMGDTNSNPPVCMVSNSRVVKPEDLSSPQKANASFGLPVSAAPPRPVSSYPSSSPSSSSSMHSLSKTPPKSHYSSSSRRASPPAQASHDRDVLFNSSTATQQFSDAVIVANASGVSSSAWRPW